LDNSQARGAAKLDEHDDQISLIFQFLCQLEQSRQQQEEQTNRKRIGFRPVAYYPSAFNNGQRF
jgi:hypothetical protein